MQKKRLAELLRRRVLAEAAEVVAEVLAPVGWMPEKMRIVDVDRRELSGGRHLTT